MPRLPRFESLRGLFGTRQFGVLLATRLTSQTADGVFQASLYGALLFNPEHHTQPEQIAGGLVLLVLPYSLVGPFVGVFLDRWRRQRVLALGAIAHGAVAALAAVLLATAGSRSVAWEAAAFGALAVNRFYLAAQSASLRYVVDEDQLVVGNAFSTTAGTVVTIVGGGLGVAIRHFAGAGDHGDAVVAAVATVGYLGSAAIAASLPAGLLGPHEAITASAAAQLRAVATGFGAGARHVWQRREAALALGVIYGQRALFGAWTILLLLLYRYSFHTDGLLRSGLVGAGQAATAGGVGFVVAALVTPRISARIGRWRWIAIATALPAASDLALGTPLSLPLFVASAVALGFAMQSTKICVDTTIQATIDADFLGRAFAIYDAGANICFATAALIAAYTLPDDGRSVPALVVLSSGYLLLSATYTAASRRTGSRSVPPEQPAQQVAQQPV